MHYQKVNYLIKKTTTQNENVEFNSYFEGGVHSKTEKLEKYNKAIC